MDELSSEPRTTEDLNIISVTDNPVLSATWALTSVKMVFQVRRQHFRSFWTSNSPTIWTTEDLNNISVTDNHVLSATYALTSVKMVIKVRRQHFRSFWTSYPPTIWTTEDLNNISVTDNPVLSATWASRWLFRYGDNNLDQI